MPNIIKTLPMKPVVAGKAQWDATARCYMSTLARKQAAHRDAGPSGRCAAWSDHNSQETVLQDWGEDLRMAHARAADLEGKLRSAQTKQADAANDELIEEVSQHHR